MCEHCNGENRFLLTDEFIKNIGFAENVTQKDLHIFQEDYFVFVDRGYLRLAGEDSDCLDHGEKIKINFCPMCGEKI